MSTKIGWRARILTTALALAVVVPLVPASSAQEQPEQTARKKHPKPAERTRNPFRDAYTTPRPSVARADLLACQELDSAVVENPRNLDLGQFKKMLSGTWVRELTWNGVVIENNSALYFDFRGPRATAMMFDQSNLGGGPMFDRVQEIRNTPRALVRTPRLTFVDCEYLIVDTYYKVSDQLLFDGLPVNAAPKRSRTEAQPLEDVWEQMVSAKFFRFEKEESRLATEPGAELFTPSVGGALWQLVLEPTRVGRYTGATLRLEGEYRGAHVSEIGQGESDRFEGVEDVRFEGTETAQFFMDGDAFVASSAPKGSSQNLEDSFPGGWLTDCADFFDLPQPVNWERVVLDPGL